MDIVTGTRHRNNRSLGYFLCLDMKLKHRVLEWENWMAKPFWIPLVTFGVCVCVFSVIFVGWQRGCTIHAFNACHLWWFHPTLCKSHWDLPTVMIFYDSWNRTPTHQRLFVKKKIEKTVTANAKRKKTASFLRCFGFWIPMFNVLVFVSRTPGALWSCFLEGRRGTSRIKQVGARNRTWSTFAD